MADERFDPETSVISFDDISFPDDNSILISPNRYPGVSFYSSGAQTWLTHLRSLSPPNSLTVGISATFPDPGTDIYPIYSVNSLVVDFAQASKNVSFWWGVDGSYNSGTISVYTDNYQLVTTVPVSFGGGSWYFWSLNQYSQRIRRIVFTRPAVSNSRQGHIYLDNFAFEPIPSYQPIGYLDTVSIQQGAATGWSLDPDSESASNQVHCYIDGNFMGATTANLPSPDVPHPGNHRFSFAIPIQFRDSNQHTINCYGIDLVGGDQPFLLNGSPKTFRFNAPIGYFDSIDPDGYAIGWSLDADLSSQSNTVHLYVNGPAGGGGAFIGSIVADVPRPDVNQSTGYPGNHGFRYYIPAQFRDNQPHTLYAYGIDLTGDNSKALTGSPKTFNLLPVVTSTVFEQLPESPLTENHNAGGGKRIFPDQNVPNEFDQLQIDRARVKVRFKLGAQVQGVRIYFKAFDIDEPSTDSLPIDINGSSSGGDNRALSTGTIYCSTNPITDCPVSGNTQYVTTNNAGEAFVYFSLRFSPSSHTVAGPGDNFAIAASTKLADTTDAVVDGLLIRNTVVNKEFVVGSDRTEMLTVWRKLHVELDSMGVVQFNSTFVQTTGEAAVDAATVEVPTRGSLDPGRFQEGAMFAGKDVLNIDKSTSNSLYLNSIWGTILLHPHTNYLIVDDDDFNRDAFPFPDGDNGEDVEILDDNLNLMKENDDTNCDDSNGCNVYAAAYIQPDFSWVAYNTSNLQFVQNVPTAVEDYELVRDQINRGRGSESDESNDFWVVYIQIAYQPGVSEDCDPNNESCKFGQIPAFLLNSTDFVRNYNDVTAGEQGALIFIEDMRDEAKNYPNSPIEPSFKTIPHEIGHQFGIRGDNRAPLTLPDQGIMGYGKGRTFVDEHLNILRWRRSSPGNVRL